MSDAEPEAHAGAALRRRWWPERDSVASQVLAIVLAGIALQTLL